MISVIIVNFNGGELLTGCVRSVLKSTVPVKVIVSDNGSIDGSIHYLERNVTDPRLSIVRNGQNLGFAAANNRVLDQAEGEYLLFLNPDCLIQPDTLQQLINIIKQRPDVGMAGCLVRNLDGSEQPGCRRRVPTPWRTAVRTLGLDRLFPKDPKFECFLMHLLPLPEQPIELEALSGAFMLVKRAALNEVGPLDEGYFLHCEDLDWCMRFRQKGWKILFIPSVEVVHAQGVCSDSRPVRVEWHKHKGMVRFYRKFFQKEYPFVLMWMVIVAVWFRFICVAAVSTFKRLGK